MIARLPVIAMLLGTVALGMLVPLVYSISEAEWRSARGFFYSGVFCMFVAAGLAVLLKPLPDHERARRELQTLLLAWLLLPCFAALPLILLTPRIGVTGAWFEMVAALTTTGGTVYPDLGRVPPAIHLWRGLVGWFGGLMTLTSAYVVLAPRRLGGFEVMAAADLAGEGRAVDLRLPAASFKSRLHRALGTIVPVYIAMTAILALLFSALDGKGLVAAVHAMSVVSTSGISPYDDGLAVARSFWVELAAAFFMIAAATRLFYWRASQVGQPVRLRSDPEIALMGTLVAVATLALFLRHWIGAIERESPGGILAGIEALWGAAFTSLSFLTTTGFHSAVWDTAENWSGHANPGMILLALCAIGGGAATTAGGVKLIRAYAMLRHGMRELERIAKPHSVGSASSGARGLRREGATIAWAFMMLFILAFVLIVLLLTLNGMSLTEALVAATAALSNTGPVYKLVGQESHGFALVDGPDRLVLALGMLLGRIETLAAIVLLNPASWIRPGARTKKTGNVAPESPLSRW